MRSRWILSLAVLAIGWGWTTPARAVITALIPMSDIVEKEQYIFVAKVGEILPDKPAMVLVPAGNLKGEFPFERMPINLAGDAEARKGKHTDVLLERIEKDLPIVVITTKRGGRYIGFGFTNGTWFSMDGRIEKLEGKEMVRWTFLHCEPYLRRTFKGTTDEMKQVVADAVAKKKAAPAPDDKEPAGFGEPIKKKSALPPPEPAAQARQDSLACAAGSRRTGTFPALGVIQLPFIGLIAGLAALFPTVFGGLALFMKRWVAALSIGGFVSIFVAIPMFAPGWSGKQWFFSASGLWLSCAILFSLGALWSIRRYRKSFDKGTAETMQPRKFDRYFVTLLFTAGLIALSIGALCSLPIWSNDYWRWVLMGTVGFAFAGTLIMTTYLRGRAQAQGRPLGIAPETVLLWVFAGTCLAYGAFEAGKYSDRGGGFVKGSGEVGQPTLSENLVWKFEPEGGGMVVNTCATPERLYVAVMVQDGLSGRLGRIFALDPNNGGELWRFDNDYDTDSAKGMKPAFSAPVYADGRLFFGEGLHEHANSRLFCLDAATGQKLWDYQTDSHTESSPCVAEGKVVIGAGYHGLHCVDIASGNMVWRYPRDAKAENKDAHVDCNPFIANGKVYAGCGYKPKYIMEDENKANRIFCLDLNTGDEVWGEPVKDAVYGSPLVVGSRVFFGTGNSTYSETIDSKRSGVLCRDAATGAELWDCRLPENVIGKPAADKRQLFVGCLDGNAYGLDLRSGEINWTVPMGGKVLAGPVADVDPKTGYANVVYFAGEHGVLQGVSPYSGAIYWSVGLDFWSKQPVGELSATPTMLRYDEPKLVRHRLFVGFGQGRSGSTTPKLYCIEDTVKKTAE